MKRIDIGKNKIMKDIAIINGKIWQDGHWIKTNIYLKDEKIDLISNEILEAKKTIDATGKFVIPGLIDSHVHFALNVGNYTSCDDFYYGSKSAAFGGITSIIDFLAPSYNANELKETYLERLEDAKKCNIDYTFHACIANPNGDLEEYVKTMKSLNLNTLKLFTTYSETNRRTYEKDIKKLLELTKKYHFLLTAHIEKDELISRDPTYSYWDLSSKARKVECENLGALEVAKLVDETRGYLYMVHTSAGSTIELIKEKYPEIINKHYFFESCPQYFTFNSDELLKENGNLFTFAPPLRSEEERKSLIKHFSYIQTIGTDHCAFMKKEKIHEKLNDFPLGVGGVESSFQIMYSLFGDEVIDKMSKNIANRFGLIGKGELKIGNDGDVVIFEKKNTKIDSPHGKCDYSIYEGKESKIKIKTTINRGQIIVQNDEFFEHHGKLIKEKNT